MSAIKFSIVHRGNHRSERVGILETKYGSIRTPHFVPVGTKATLKSVQTKDLEGLNIDVILANTYHLFLQPGDKVIKEAGGIHQFMNWSGPIMTDSGGFQVFSLGTGFGEKISKIAITPTSEEGLDVFRDELDTAHVKLARIDEEGVTFTSHLDGSLHRFTPERSIEIQHNIGADIIFAFDECTSPLASFEYQKEALNRTHRWAKRSRQAHLNNPSSEQALFGIVQGGRFEDLRKESAKAISEMSFDGYGIGGSFAKEDMAGPVRWVNEILPEHKPRHLLGIGEPRDILMGVEEGCDLFDCVSPTRLARHGTIYTTSGPIHLHNEEYKKDFSVVDEEKNWDLEGKYTKAYLSHLFRADEMLGATLSTINNIAFMGKFMSDIRDSIEHGNFSVFKQKFLKKYYGQV